MSISQLENFEKFQTQLFEKVECKNELFKKALERLDISSVRDLILHKPNYYILKKLNPEFQDIVHGDTVILSVTVINHNQKSKMKQYIVKYKNIFIDLVFFRSPPVFVSNALIDGKSINISGKIVINDNRIQIHHPDIIFNIKNLDLIEPIYPLTYGIINKQLHSIIKVYLQKIKNTTTDEKLLDFIDIISDIHVPKLLNTNEKLPPIEDIKDHLKNNHKAISLLELTAHNAAMQILRTKEREKGRKFSINQKLQDEILTKLKFNLTNGQKTALHEIQEDQQKNKMIRLLQGDVGVGKTLVALLSAVNVVDQAQVAIMCPTDILSVQHYNFFVNTLEEFGIKVALLTGCTKQKDRYEILRDLEKGKIRIIIGTHALFQSDVKFANLGYVIVDEQHRFGVMQRFALAEKGINPDTLIMTATPIPRSLCLALFGDIDTSKIETRIADRLPIVTVAMPKSKIKDVISQLNDVIARREQIYWVCPLIEKEEESESHLQDAQIRFLQLKEIYGDKVGLVTGNTDKKSRTSIMQRFHNGEILILVATTVIEVGIDVKNATLIVIEDAQQFGLAQLHQLRGRVGRGNKQSFCVLLYNHKMISQVAKERLSIMKKSNDGFYIAEKDLELRGSGEILGVSQSGTQKFFFFNEEKDIDLLSKINRCKIDIYDLYINTMIQIFVKKNLDFDSTIKIG